MDYEEAKRTLENLIPVGKERWIKVKYLDMDKVLDNINPLSSSPEEDEERGFEVLSLGVVDEYTPQISALLEVKNHIVSTLHGDVADYLIMNILDMINGKMDELKSYTIKDVKDLKDES